MGKSSDYYTAKGGRRGPWKCLGCRSPIIYGDRCPDCARELRRRTAAR